MKRIISIVVLLTILFSGFVPRCVADDLELESVTFRNIPWYSTLPDAREILDADETLSSKRYIVSSKQILDDWCQDQSFFYSDLHVKEGCAEISFYSKENWVSVAGYKGRLFLYFIYPIIDGWIIRDNNKSEFITAEYFIYDLDNSDKAYHDLRDKLISLYSSPCEPRRTEAFFSSNSIEKETFWEARDGSIIWLVLRKDDAISITYSAPNSTERIIELGNQTEYEKNLDTDNSPRETSIPGDTTGL